MTAFRQDTRLVGYASNSVVAGILSKSIPSHYVEAASPEVIYGLQTVSVSISPPFLFHRIFAASGCLDKKKLAYIRMT